MSKHEIDNPLHPDAELQQHEDKEVLHYLQEYGRPLAIGIGGALLIFLGIAVYRGHQANQAQEAAQKLSAAQNVEQLQAVVTEYENTPSGPSALLRLASVQYDQGNYPLAKHTYASFENRYPEHVMLPAADLGSCYCLEAEGLYEEAQVAFAAFVETHPTSFLVPMAVFGAGRCFEQQENYDAARALYEDFLVANAESPWAPQAETALLYLNRSAKPTK